MLDLRVINHRFNHRSLFSNSSPLRPHKQRTAKWLFDHASGIFSECSTGGWKARRVVWLRVPASKSRSGRLVIGNIEPIGRFLEPGKRRPISEFPIFDLRSTFVFVAIRSPKRLVKRLPLNNSTDRQSLPTIRRVNANLEVPKSVPLPIVQSLFWRVSILDRPKPPFRQREATAAAWRLTYRPNFSGARTNKACDNCTSYCADTPGKDPPRSPGHVSAILATSAA